jgi:hypothetical protein
MTGLEAVTAVAVYLNSNKTAIFGEKGGSIFKYEKKKGYEGDYIAVNNLPFIHRNTSQTDTVNVNVHVKDLNTEEPDTKRLAAIVKEVVEMFNYTDGVRLNEAYFKYFADGRPIPDKDGTSYVNIEIDCYHSEEKKVTTN